MVEPKQLILEFRSYKHKQTAHSEPAPAPQELEQDSWRAELELLYVPDTRFP